MMGYCDIENYCIKLKKGLTDQATAVTFYHELVHAILFTMGKMQHDEEFVDAFGSLLYQFMRTLEDVEEDCGNGN